METFSTTPTKAWLKALNMDHIYDVFESHGFTTVGSLKEMRDEDFETIFSTPNKLKLGERRVLEARLRSLRKGSFSSHEADETLEKASTSGADALSRNSSIISKKAAEFERSNQTLQSKLESLQEDLRLLEQPVKELERLGRGTTVCGNCHHKGHRNDARHACEYISCVGFHYCGQKKLHPEYSQQVNGIKKQIKLLKKDIDKGSESLKVISEFESKSETYFFQEMTPRVKVLDWNRYQNKARLFKDLRLLRTAFNGKVPPKSADDRNYLKNILEREYNKIKETSGKFVVDDHYDETEVSPIKFNSSGLKRMLTYEKCNGDSSVDESDSDTSSSSSESSTFSETTYDRYKGKNAKGKKRKRLQSHKLKKQKRYYRKKSEKDFRKTGSEGSMTMPAICIPDSPPRMSPITNTVTILSPSSPITTEIFVNQTSEGAVQAPLQNRKTVVNDRSYGNSSGNVVDTTRQNIDTLLLAASLRDEHKNTSTD